MRRVPLLLLAAALAGCASRSAEITPTYVSPIMYQGHTCAQLAAEAQGVSARAAQVSGAQDQKRTNDQIATGVAIVVFWPAAFFVGGDGPVAAELANLKGQMVAIEQASIQKNCAISFQRTAEGAPAAGYSQAPPPAPPPVQTKQTSAKQKANAKQTAPPPAPPPAQAYVAPEPPTPTLSESDRAAMQRN